MRFSILLLLVLVGCSAPATRTELSTDAAKQGAVIGVLPINTQQKVEARVDDNPIGFAGTAGRLAVFKGEQTRQKRLVEALTEADFAYRKEVNRRLREAFVESRLNLKEIKFNRTIDNVLGEVAPGRFERRPPKDQPVDFLLDVYIDVVGYIAPSINQDYLPTLHVGARLLDANTLDEVYLTRVEYNPLDADEATITLEADSSFAFKDTEAMLADKDRAAEGLAKAMDAVAEQLRADMMALAAPEGG